MVFDFDDLDAAVEAKGTNRSRSSLAKGKAASEITVRVCGGLSGQVICTVAVDPTFDVRVLKERIAKEANISALEQRLLVAGSCLGDNDILQGALPTAAGGAFDISMIRLDPKRSKTLSDLQHGRLQLTDVDEELRQEVDIVVAAVRRDGTALRYASENFRKDRTIVDVAIKANGEALQFADEVLRDDRGLVLAAVKSRGLAIRHASSEVQADRDIAIAAVRQEGLALQYVSEELRGDFQIVLLAVERRGDAIRYASDAARADREIAKVALKTSWGTALQYIAEELREDREVLRIAIELDGEALQYANPMCAQDRDIVIAAVSNCGASLRHAAMNWRADREVVYEAVCEHPHALKYASAGLQDDRDLVRAAVERDGAALKHASTRLRGDSEIVKKALESDPCALGYSTETALEDRDVLLALLRRNPANATRWRAARAAILRMMGDQAFREAMHEMGLLEDSIIQGLLMLQCDVARPLLESGSAIFVDARMSAEFEMGHITGAHSLPFNEVNSDRLRPILSVITENSAISTVVYSDNCLEYSRCVGVANALRQKPGVLPHRVLRLEGGLNLWKARGGAVDGDVRTMHLGRVVSGIDLEKILGIRQ